MFHPDHQYNGWTKKSNSSKRQFKREKMANLQNLKPIKTRHQAITLGRLGGLAKSKLKTWQKVKKCTSKCPFYCSCPFVTSSIQSEGLCILKRKKILTNNREITISEELIASFFSLFESGKRGLLNEALASVFKIRLRNQNASTDELHKYVHTIIDIKKAFYPEKEGVCDMNITPSFEPPVWMTQLEAERRMRELKKKNDAIDTTATVQTDVD